MQKPVPDPLCPRIVALTLFGVLGCLHAPTPASAQGPEFGRIMIQVVDEARSAPLAGVQVRLVRAGVAGFSNAQGLLEVRSPLLGPDTLALVYLGYGSERVPVFLNPGQTATLRVTMTATPIPLQTVVVRTGPAPPAAFGAFAGFWERRARAQGYFVTRAEIDELRATHSTDILRGIPGLRLIASRSGTFDVRLGRPRPISRDPVYRMRALHDNPDVPPNDCPIQLFVDGHPYANDTMSFDEAFRPNEIEAIEVYNSPGQTPAQFGGTRAQCGVIVVWLRRSV
jgi:hypothetical protein